MAQVSVRSALHNLTCRRLLELSDRFGMQLLRCAPKPAIIEELAINPVLYREFFDKELLTLEELRKICRTHNLDERGRTKAPLIARILKVHTPLPLAHKRRKTRASP